MHGEHRVVTVRWFWWDGETREVVDGEKREVVDVHSPSPRPTPLRLSPLPKQITNPNLDGDNSVHHWSVSCETVTNALEHVVLLALHQAVLVAAGGKDAAVVSLLDVTKNLSTAVSSLGLSTAYAVTVSTTDPEAKFTHGGGARAVQPLGTTTRPESDCLHCDGLGKRGNVTSALLRSQLCPNN